MKQDVRQSILQTLSHNSYFIVLFYWKDLNFSPPGRLASSALKLQASPELFLSVSNGDLAFCFVAYLSSSRLIRQSDSCFSFDLL